MRFGAIQMKQHGEIRLILVALACSVALGGLGCGGGNGEEATGGTGGGTGGTGGSGDTGGSGGAVETPIDVTATGRVGLGTIGGASVDVYAYDDLANPIQSVVSSTGTLEDAGRFSFDLDQVLPSDAFLIVVTGGAAVDVDENGTTDPSSTPNVGTFHCIATAEQLADGDVFVSVMSELIYWRLRYLIGAEYDASFVMAAADSWATHVLSSSIDGDGDVDWRDVLAFDGAVHQGQTIRPYSSYTPMALSVLAGAALHVPGFELTQAEILYADLTGNGRGIDLVDGRMYFGSNDRFAIYDVSDPTTPAELGNYMSGSPSDIQVVDELAYLASFGAGLQILNVANPAMITLAGEVMIPSAQALQVVGNLAYVLQSSFDDAALHVVDVAGPGSASIVGSAELSGDPRQLVVHGNYVYVSKGSAPIEIIDVSDTAEPRSVGSAPVNATVAGLAVVGEYLLAASSVGMEVFDISEPEDPTSVASVAIPSDSFAASITVADGRAYLTRGFDGIHVIDISNPATPVRLGVLPISSVQAAVAVEGALMVTSDTNGGFHTAAAGIPIASAAVGEVRFAGQARSVVVADSQAYVGTAGPNELWVVDVSEPQAATRQGGVVLPSAANAVQVRGSLVFAATDRDGLLAIDVSDQAMPVVAGADGTEQNLTTLVLGENTAYAAGGSELHVIDISTPTTPTPQAPVPLNRAASCTARDGDTLLVCQGFIGVQGLSIVFPTMPVGGSANADTKGATDIAIGSGKAFVADRSGQGIGAGVQVVDYSNFNAPTPEAFLVLPGNANRIAIGGEHAYVGVGSVGVEVAHVADPTDMKHVGSLPLPAEVRDVTTNADFVYAIGDQSLYVMRRTTRSVP